MSTGTSAPAQTDLRLVVPSCDAYCDIWPFFFHFLFKYWPDVPTPVYLISNHLSYDDPRVTTVKVGEDKHWTDGMAIGLRQIPAEYVIHLLDDFLLTKPLPLDEIFAVYAELKKRNGNWVNLKPMGPVPEDDPQALIAPITDTKQSAGLHSGLWCTQYFADLCAQRHLNIWQTEGFIRELIRTGKTEGLFYLTRNKRWLVPYTEVLKRFWQKHGIDFLREHGLKPNLWRRPYPPQGGDPFSRFIRSILKRYTRLAATREARYWFAHNNGKVKPLPQDRQPASS
jgi:hypothetical protein